MKKYITYNDDELVSVIIGALTITINCFAITIYNIALKGRLEFLAPVVDSFNLNRTDLALVDCLDDPLSLTLGDSLVDVDNVREGLCTIYKYKWRKLMTKKGLRITSSELFERFIIHPRKDEETDQFFNTREFIQSLICMIIGMCELLKGRKVSPQRIKGKVAQMFSSGKFPLSAFMGDKECMEIKLLVHLGESLLMVYEKLQNWENHLHILSATALLPGLPALPSIETTYSKT